ncbi:hypothetical protein CEXT_758771 [Caerostris extrusa]|uniref:Uncharacterized protein n=1 Tax=Caerostris extrusa TaxID=172846 RepID=A0AAV4U5F8_CAEEX|nr:hypothetical protein CEXT_758771 [Caerostris extrusa]
MLMDMEAPWANVPISPRFHKGFHREKNAKCSRYMVWYFGRFIHDQQKKIDLESGTRTTRTSFGSHCNGFYTCTIDFWFHSELLGFHKSLGSDSHKLTYIYVYIYIKKLTHLVSLAHLYSFMLNVIGWCVRRSRAIKKMCQVWDKICQICIKYRGKFGGLGQLNNKKKWNN